MKKLLLAAMLLLLTCASYAQFTTHDNPGFLEIGTIQQASNGRLFLLSPLTINGGRSALLNQNWLSWGYGGLVGRELLFDDLGAIGFDSMSFGVGAWGSIDFASVIGLKIMIGLSIHAIYNPKRDASYAGTIFLGIRG